MYRRASKVNGWLTEGSSRHGRRRHGKNAIAGMLVAAMVVLTGMAAGAPSASAASASDPFGSLDRVAQYPGGEYVEGWAIDPDVVTSIAVHVYVDNAFATSGIANVARPDVALAFPAYSAKPHGYRIPVRLAAGRHHVCTWAINEGPGASTMLGCKDIDVQSHSPFGQLDEVWATPGGVRLRGWAIDSDTTDPVSVRVTVDGKTSVTGTFATGLTYLPTANASRPDVGTAYPYYGSGHGFDLNVPMAFTPGNHSVCVLAVNIGLGFDTWLNCRSVSVLSANPSGNLDTAKVDLYLYGAGLLQARVVGWAIDGSTVQAIKVRVYIDGHETIVQSADGTQATTTTANVLRTDVGGLYSGYGPNHGFDALASLASTGLPNGGYGDHNVCVVGINVGPGSDAVIGACRTVTPTYHLGQHVATMTVAPRQIRKRGGAGRARHLLFFFAGPKD